MTLRILMTLDAVGGVWRYSMDLSHALQSMGHKIVFAGLGPPPSAAQRQEAEAIGTLIWGTAPLDWMAQDAAALDSVGPWLKTLAARHRVDLMHLNLPSQALGTEGAVPRVVVTHSCLATWFDAVTGGPVPARLAWQAELTRMGLLAADVAVAPSHAHAKATAKVLGVNSIMTVPNGSRAAPRPHTHSIGQVVSAGRWWDKGKNGLVLDEAAGLMRQSVMMIGACTGPDGQNFIAKHARAAGPLPYGQTQAQIAQASVFISPSRYEPFGLAALEAARASRPLLLADIPVYRENWEGAAQFFDPMNPQDLAAKADALAADAEACEAMGAASMLRSLDYSTSKQAHLMQSLYDKALSRAAVA